jgi:hypothetical protein
LNDTTYVEIGFYIAATIATLAWNFDWRHYSRYFLGLGRRRGTTAEFVVRAFFLACVIASASQLAWLVLESSMPLDGWIASLGYAVVTLAAMLILDLFFRWRLGRPKE